MSSSHGATYLTLPWPPTINTYWRHMTIRGKPVVSISARGRDYRKAVIGEVLRRCVRKPEPMTGAVAVRLELWPPDRRIRDIDNYAKAIFDAMTHAGVWRDDSQVDELHIYRMGVQAPGAAVVEIWEREGNAR